MNNKCSIINVIRYNATFRNKNGFFSMKTVKIGNKKIGGNSPCYIIAEIGINHLGKMKLAEKMIQAASEAGADAVKFQAYKSEGFASKEKMQDYKTFKSCELNEKQFRQIKKIAGKKGLEFFASAFDAESADLLQKLQIPCFKIGSGELTNIPLLKHIAKKKKPIILSTGLASELEIKQALKAIYSTGNKKVVLLHCVAEYPAPIEKLNLRKIAALKKKFKVPVGFSDHSLGINAAIAATALGAKAIEKHFTSDKNLPGPDQAMSSDAAELKRLVEAIRQTELALGTGSFKAVEGKKSRILARKSLAALQEIKAGETITEKKVFAKRPATGIGPNDIGRIIGKKAKAKIMQGETLTWKKIQR